VSERVRTDAATTTAETVSLTIPAKPEYVSIARLTVAAVAARHGFTYDEIEDLKIAVSEACAAAIPPNGVRPPLKLRFVLENGGLAAWVESGRAADAAAGGSNAASDDPATLGVFLMQCLVDDVRRVEDPDGVVCLRLLKRRQEGTQSGPPSSEH
jgi:anti-sigma regulatory factor (Ser/Thr protein kinase)